MKKSLILLFLGVILYACEEQKDYPAGTLSVDDVSYTVSSAATTKTFNFQCNTGWKVEVLGSGSAEWCKVAVGSEEPAGEIWGKNNATVTVSIASNTTLGERKANVRVRAGSVYYDIPVVQAEKDGFVVTFANNLDITKVDGLANEFAFTVASNQDITVTCDDVWLNFGISQKSKPVAEQNYTATVSDNPSTTATRTATLKIRSANDSKDIQIIQLAAPAPKTDDVRIVGMWQVIDNEASYAGLDVGMMLTFGNDGSLKSDDVASGTTTRFNWFIQRDRISILDENNAFLTYVMLNESIDARNVLKCTIRDAGETYVNFELMQVDLSVITILFAPVWKDNQTALFTANVVVDGGKAVTEKGFVWGSTSSINLDQNAGKYTAPTGGLGKYSYEYAITPSNKVYVRAYAKNADGVIYGDVIEFVMPLGDINGNLYEVKKVGDQLWTVENVRTTSYNDGTPMIDGTENSAWTSAATAKAGAYCWLSSATSATQKFEADTYNNIPDNKKIASTYGRFYNSFAARNSKFAPAGWRVATSDDYKALFIKIYGSNITDFSYGTEEGYKSAVRNALCNWTRSGETNANTYGFNGLIHAYRGWSGSWGQTGWWTSTPGICVFMRPGSYCSIDADTESVGYPIRLIKE